jgi:hypothetical protein
VRCADTGNPTDPQYREWTQREIWDLITQGGRNADPRDVELWVRNPREIAGEGAVWVVVWCVCVCGGGGGAPPRRPRPPGYSPIPPETPHPTTRSPHAGRLKPMHAAQAVAGSAGRL